MAAGDPIDDLTAWLGLRWESAERVRLTIRPERPSGPYFIAISPLSERA